MIVLKHLGPDPPLSSYTSRRTARTVQGHEREEKKPPNRTPQIALICPGFPRTLIPTYMWGGYEGVRARQSNSLDLAHHGPFFLFFFSFSFHPHQSYACDQTYKGKSGGHGYMHGQMWAWSGHARTVSGRVHGRIGGQIILVRL